MSTKLSNRAHSERPWRIHELTRGFRVEDVWALPMTGTRNDFHRLVHLLASFDMSRTGSPIVRTLFVVRERLGALLGWDAPDVGIGSRVESLRERMPADLRNAPPGPAFETLPFTPLYLLDDEFAAESANATMHGVLHLGWVREGANSYRGQMAILVQPNHLLGDAYMLAIKPFRYFIVYPAIIRQLDEAWKAAIAPS